MVIARHDAPREKVSNSGIYGPVIVKHIFCGRIKAVANATRRKTMGWSLHRNSPCTVVNTVKP